MRKPNNPHLTCPICSQKLTPDSKDNYIPFCSSRCKTIDLGNWLSDNYRIPIENNEDAADNLNHNSTTEDN